jgi:carboxyl-terminal processing protease
MKTIFVQFTSALRILAVAALACSPLASPGQPAAAAEAKPAAKPGAAESLRAGPLDSRIAPVVAAMLQNNHYSKKVLNDETSSLFLDRYLKSLDPQRLHFLQGDIDGFEGYRNRLDDLTVRRQVADTSPAYVIFSLFLHRLEERVAYCTNLLQTEKFEFTGDDHVLLDRKDAPYPKTLAEARLLWRDRLRAEYLQEKLAKKKPEEIVKLLTKRYNRILKMYSDFDNENVLEIYLGALSHVYDPHTDYLGKSALENFSIGMNLSLFGIGAELRQTPEDGLTKISRLMAGPAEKSKKIKVGDKIVAVAQADGEMVDIVDMPLNKAVQLIRGPKGSEVRLAIEPGDADQPRYEITLVREEIKLEDQEAKAKLIELDRAGQPPLKLGVVDLPSFYASMDLGTANGKGESRSTTADVATLIEKLTKEGAEGIVLDLRRNGGGSLEEAVALAGLFIKTGPVVQVRDWNGRINVNSDKDPEVAYDGPLVVLTSRFSASASEIVAAALQDHGRALIVGDRTTHGKGTVQSLNSLKQLRQVFPPEVIGTNDPGALKLTIRKFYRANGHSTQLKGVTPDVVLTSVANHLDVGESSLDNPLQSDSIAPADFDALDLVAPYVDELRRRSEARIASAKDYDYVREDVELYQKNKAEKSVSLNEAERLKEKQEADARKKSREKERASRPPLTEKVYDLTLKLASQPGLPPPTERTNTVSTVFEGATHSGGGTNIATVTATKPIRPNGGDEEEDEEDGSKPPADDFALREVESILADYILLLKQSGVTANTKPETVR